MPTLFLTVFDGADIKLVDEPVQQTSVTVGGTSTQSAAILGPTGKLRNVRLMTDTDCFVEWGENPTALNDGTGGMPLGAENPEVVGIQAGHLVAVIERV